MFLLTDISFYLLVWLFLPTDISFTHWYDWFYPMIWLVGFINWYDWFWLVILVTHWNGWFCPLVWLVLLTDGISFPYHYGWFHPLIWMVLLTDNSGFTQWYLLFWHASFYQLVLLVLPLVQFLPIIVDASFTY